MRLAKRLLAFIIMLAVLVTSVPLHGFGSMTAYAAETTRLTVTGDIVNIRKGAGTSYAKVTTVTRSTVLTSLGTSKDSSGTVWYKVNVNGSTGYIVSTFVSASTTSSADKTLEVTGTTVYVRKGAGTSYGYITTVKKGAKYSVLGSAKDSSGKVWYKISINNTTGYIISTYVKVSGNETASTTKPTSPSSTAAPKQKLTVTGDIVNIRKGAGTSNPKVTTVKRNATFDVLGSSKDSSGTVWYKINVNGTTGYIVSTYAKVTNVTTTTAATTTTTTTTTGSTTTSSLLITVPASSGTTTTTTTTSTTTRTSVATGSTIAPNVALMITAGNVDVRSGAGDSYSLMSTLKSGQEVVILSNRTDSSGNLWYRIRFGMFSGYVKASVLDAATATTVTTTSTAASTTANTQNGTTATTDLFIPPRGTTTTTTQLFIPPAGTTATQSDLIITTTNDISENITTTAKDTDTRNVQYGTVKCDTKLNVRSGAGTGYGILGTLKNGTQVVIAETKGNWYKIEYGSGYGYVMSEFVTNVKIGTITISLSFARPYYYVELGSTVNVSINLPGYTVTYTSKDSSAAPVTAKGVVTGKKPGLYTITAKAGSASATTEVVVLKAKNSGVSPMTISEAGTRFIAEWEGGGTPLGEVLVFYPYQDVSGYWTVGYGHAVTSTESKQWTREQAVEHFNKEITDLLGEGHEITEDKPYLTAEEAAALLNADLNDGPYVKAVSDWAVRNGVVLSQNQFDALVSFCYNLGPAYWTSDTYYFYLKSAIIAYRNGNDAVPEQVIEGFTRYIKSGGVNLKGLWWRRRNEAEMFLKGDYAIDRENKFTLPNITWG